MKPVRYRERVAWEAFRSNLARIRSRLRAPDHAAAVPPYRHGETTVRTAPILTELFGVPPQRLDGGAGSHLPVFNPTVARNGGRHVFVSKSCNIVVRDGARTTILPDVYRNEPVVHLLDGDLGLLERTRLDDRLLRDGGRDWRAGLEGLGDQRLFVYDDELWMLGSAVWHDRIGQVLCRLDGGTRIAHAVELPSPVGAPTEKNWVPVVIGRDVYVLYSIDPLVAYRLDMDTGALDHVASTSPPGEHRDVTLRGNTRFVPVADGLLLGIGHHPPVVLDQPYYLHRFVLINERLEVLERSEPFFLQLRGIEFACGLERLDDSLLISYGVDDQIGAHLRLPLDRMHRLLGHLT